MAIKKFDVPNIGCFEYNSLTNYISYVRTEDEPCAENDAVRQSSIVWGKSFEELKDAMNHNLKSLVLQMTRRCNLNCEYCAYSGEFDNMLPHADENMILETIYKSIDFFMEHSDSSDDLMIIFYGGEPLTEFDNIVNAVGYANQYARKTRFGISSNGVLIDDRIINWLKDNPEVYLTVTVNGGKHDLYRKRLDGSGSLSMIVNNLLKIKSNYPEIWDNQIRLISNICSMNEIYELRKFYLEMFEKIPSMITKLNLNYCTDNVADKFKTDITAERNISEKLIDEFIDTNDSFLGVLYNERLDSIHNRGLCSRDTPGYIGSCMPLSWRLFVRTDGSFNMCEKVTDMISLGDLDNGYNYNAVENLYLQLKEFFNGRCRNCWAQRLCMFCYQDFLDEKGKINYDFPKAKCENMKESIESYLKMYVRIIYEYPDRFT